VRVARSTSGGDGSASPFSVIPSVTSLLDDETLRTSTSLGDVFLVAFLRDRLAQEREAIARGEPRTEAEIRARLTLEILKLERARLDPVINATGVIVHTNLGRAPVSRATAAAMAATAASAVALEIEPDSARRGGRMAEIGTLMRLLTGAEATLVVNNNAAAVLLVLSAIAAGREVVLSRGEAVEIGGGFRIPDVLHQSGATLVEVGTTNRTYPHDYAAALSERTAALLKVHPSNFRLSGFVRGATVAELASIARARGIALVEDLGSGALIDTAPYGLAPEPTIGASLAAGVSVVTASGDKLLGGPQAGIICGDAQLVSQIERHPLARAVRADKTCLAGLAATLRHYVREEATREIPVWRMIAASLAEIRGRAAVLKAMVAAVGHQIDVVETPATIGGGSLPGEVLPSASLALRADCSTSDGTALEALARRLRLGQPAVFGRIEEGRLLLDLRTVLPEDDERLGAAVVTALAGPVG
jgi:L-seryl-tRNA(Ser) seleniumtransferase